MAHACSANPEPITRSYILAQPGKQIDLTLADLLTIVLPADKGSPNWRVDISPSDAPPLRALTASQLASALESNRFHTIGRDSYVAQRERRLGQASPQLHFGAVRTGQAQLRLTNESLGRGHEYVMNVVVKPLPNPIAQSARGMRRTVTDSQQGREVRLQFYDTLEVVVPGSALSQWETNAVAVGLSLVEKQAVDPGKVKFVFKVVNSQAPAVLTLQQTAGSDSPVHAFPIKHEPTPTC